MPCWLLLPSVCQGRLRVQSLFRRPCRRALWRVSSWFALSLSVSLCPCVSDKLLFFFAAEYGLRLFSESCQPDSECRDAPWAFTLVGLAAVLIAFFLVATAADKSSSTTLSVLLFFYQVLSLVKS